MRFGPGDLRSGAGGVVRPAPNRSWSPGFSRSGFRLKGRFQRGFPLRVKGRPQWAQRFPLIAGVGVLPPHPPFGHPLPLGAREI